MGRKPYDQHYMMSLEFTTEEIGALQLIAEGGSRKEFADKLGIGYKAVDYRLSRICDKLGAVNIPHAVAIGITRGIIKVEA